MELKVELKVELGGWGVPSRKFGHWVGGNRFNG